MARKNTDILNQVTCSKCKTILVVTTQKDDPEPSATIIDTSESKGWRVQVGSGALSGLVAMAICPGCLKR